MRVSQITKAGTKYIDAMDLLNQIHFVDLPSPCSIYGSCVCTINRRNVLLAASGGSLFVLSSSVNLRNRFLSWKFQELELPSEVRLDEIFAVHSFTYNGGPVICLVGIKQEENVLVYFGGKIRQPATLKDVLATSQLHRLGYTPFFVKSLYVGGNLPLILVSGSDSKIHTYEMVEDGIAESPRVLEELLDLPAPALALDVKWLGHRRLTAVGFQNGIVQISLKDENSSETKPKIERMQIDGPVDSVSLFITKASLQPDSQDATLRASREFSDVPPLFARFFMLSNIYKAQGHAVVFSDIIKNSFANPFPFEQELFADAVTCGLVADLHWDGSSDIVFGTYGEKLLGYRPIISSDDPEKITGWEPFVSRFFSQPVLGFHFADFSNDGISELVAVTQFGIHIFQVPRCSNQQAKLDTALATVENELDMLLELSRLEKVLKEKQQERDLVVVWLRNDLQECAA